jgi:hypothetical protein
VAAPLDVAGQIRVDLFANTDPATDPAGSYYTVQEVIFGQPTRTYRVIIPHNLGSPLGLALLAEAYPSTLTALSGYGGGGYGITGYGV